MLTENLNDDEEAEPLKNATIIPQKITLQLILDRNLTPKHFENLSISTSTDSTTFTQSDLTAKALLQLTHIYLDRSRIDEIDNLAEYTSSHRLTHLYLQHNLIKKIENLDFLHNLKFLVLSHNLITRIENLSHLSHLLLLDLSSNLIDRVIDEDVSLPSSHRKQRHPFPISLAFLDLRDNPALSSSSSSAQNDLENALVQSLPNLVQLNGVNLVSEGDEDEDEGNSHEDERDLVSDSRLVKMKETIVDRSKLRHQDDLVNLERGWEQKKLKLETIETSIKEKFRKLEN